jgi:hypothetical protein
MSSRLMNKTHNEILHVIFFCITGIFLFSSCATVPGPEGEIIIPAQWGYFTDPASFATDSDGNYYVVAREINLQKKAISNTTSVKKAVRLLNFHHLNQSQ